MSEQPKKQSPKNKRQRLNLTRKQIWERILKDVEKSEVPLHCIDRININLTDGTEIVLDIGQLLAEGNDPEFLEEAINSRLESLDEIIDDVDFMISVEKVAKTVQPFTDELLKNL
jgi:hypothetical protein